MSLFPEIDLTSYLEVSASANGVSPTPASVSPAVQPPSGQLRGLAQALIDLLSNYSPGETGVSQLSPQLQLTLPDDDWATWAWSVIYPYTYSAGESGVTTVYTVPDDERAYLWSIHSRIASGDNTLSNIAVTPPAAYLEGTGAVTILGLTGTASEIFWPDPGGIQTVEHSQNGWPIMVEPGTVIGTNLKGVGVSSGIMSTTLILRKSKLVRAQSP